jgi:two-component system CheB/CheR fusion protein
VKHFYPVPGASPPFEPPRLVVIGASAGGLDALEKLFTGLSPELGAAFIVIQHLSPDHKSMMRDLLARHTCMPVIQVEDDMPVVLNQVYLIPPGAVMSFQRDHLRLTPRSANSLVLPIDIFLQSLARQNGQNAIVVILSGSGSDGSRGAVAIHEAGGLLLVQDPAEAKFDGMPRSVIDTGLVDYVLPVAAMPARISAYLRMPTIVPGWGADRPFDQPASVLHPDAALAGILHLLLQLGGIDFDEYKTGTVLRRIERRMAARQLSSIQAYFELLNQDRAEAMTLRH